MKIKINSYGNLSMTRKNDVFKDCYCPFSSDNIQRRCGDWCPLFLVEMEDTLQLCRITYSMPYDDFTEDIIDERK